MFGKKKIFHGGCHTCSMQSIVGTLICKGCQHYDANWNKPNFNTSDIKRWLHKQLIKILPKFLFKAISEPTIFHGGCLGCQSQQLHGIKRCTGCKYFEANWNLPDLSSKIK